MGLGLLRHLERVFHFDAEVAPVLDGRVEMRFRDDAGLEQRTTLETGGGDLQALLKGLQQPEGSG